jgi:hypothetical protein
VPFVNKGIKDQFAVLDARWQPLKAQYNSLIQNDIPAFNALCRSKNIDKITVTPGK